MSNKSNTFSQIKNGLQNKIKTEYKNTITTFNGDIKNTPITISIIILLIIIYSLYTTGAIKNLPCEKNVISHFYGNFVHINIYHLIGNVFSLYALSRVEKAIGSTQFISLITFLLFFNSIIESLAHSVFKDIPCSLGFSGVILGIIAWEMVSDIGIDLNVIATIGLLVILPSLQNNRASLFGHLIGAFSGIIGGLLWKVIQNKSRVN